MLQFICDICNKKFEVVSVDGPDSFTYSSGNRRNKTTTDTPCHECLEEADKAREEALEKRKAQRTI